MAAVEAGLRCMAVETELGEQVDSTLGLLTLLSREQTVRMDRAEPMRMAVEEYQNLEERERLILGVLRRL